MSSLETKGKLQARLEGDRLAVLWRSALLLLGRGSKDRQSGRISGCSQRSLIASHQDGWPEALPSAGLGLNCCVDGCLCLGFGLRPRDEAR